MSIKPQPLYLKIAGIIIQVTFQSHEKLNRQSYPQKLIIDAIKKQYRGFIMHKTPTVIDCRIEFCDILEQTIQKKGAIYDISFFEEKATNVVLTYYHISIFQFSFIIRKILVAHLKNKGFFLHASASLVKHQAYVFIGRSGAGKTTIMTLLTKMSRPLSDDHVLILKEDNQFYYYQIPFFEKGQAIIKKTSRRHKLGKIFFLKKAGFLKLKHVSEKNIVLHMLLEQRWVDDEHLQKQAKVILDFVSRFSHFYYLFFSKNRKKLTEFINRS